MSRLIIFAPVWNDMDWLEAMISQVEYWNPDELYLLEGCWDTKFPARSTDGTREYIMDYKNKRPHTYVVDNIRAQGYRENQCMTCNLILELSKAEKGDWIMYQSCDFFLLKNHINRYKKLMKDTNMDYPIHEIWNFWDTPNKYYPRWNDQSPNLPYRIVKGMKFIPTCHPAINGKIYKDSSIPTGLKIDNMIGFHYEGFRNDKRIKDKYAVGDRQSPVVWKDGIKLKQRMGRVGIHPEFAEPVLKEKGFLSYALE